VDVIWHDLECGSYVEDLELWRSLAAGHGDPVLDIGAGTGRVALYLARNGFRVTALDCDQELLAELARRAAALDVKTELADARRFELGRRFSLCVVPMQTIQLLGGTDGRAEFLRNVERHLADDGVLAVAISDVLDLFDAADGDSAPLPDICEHEGVLYASHPTAVRADGDGFLLERRREVVTLNGTRSVAEEVVRLDRLSVEELEQEAQATGLRVLQTRTIAPTPEHVGSEVVILHR
jgi:SAM-dependent methyltransferase